MGILHYIQRWLDPALKDQVTARFEGDDVYPVHTMDSLQTIRDYANIWTLCFNDVLSPELLREALAKLIETGDWRKIGGRLRSRVRKSIPSYPAVANATIAG